MGGLYVVFLVSLADPDQDRDISLESPFGVCVLTAEFNFTLCHDGFAENTGNMWARLREMHARQGASHAT